ncbi:DUF5134 domain-containing protein [Mycobacterium sp. TNTM28]|uniref:DUF5134 domain-containing protein n=1 Tax=[Mycobacterium] fortunisiensis TaxID=2600579 RepID=A0ABS6KQE8_9MYCO|nr:DUF5134 domain-containing protein [[Mycobacterium] fortunisiensis]MBU9765855.1 DUF5134 domain-containing protein [[Mycobacterium] fortunisiensis]
MIADVALRWVVTVLFGLSALECIYAFAGAHERPSVAVSQLLHLAMAVAMLVMAWPRGAELPSAGPMYFFVAAAVWFLAAAVRPGNPARRLIGGYDAAMMAAMAWMYAAMNGAMAPRHEPSMEMEMAGHDMHAMAMTTTNHGPAQPLWMLTVNWVIMVCFVLAAVVWLHRYFAARQQSGAGASPHFGTLCRAMMAAGMAIMFGLMT